MLRDALSVQGLLVQTRSKPVRAYSALQRTQWLCLVQAPTCSELLCGVQEQHAASACSRRPHYRDDVPQRASCHGKL